MIAQKLSTVMKRQRPLKYLLMRALKGTRLCLLFQIDRNSYRLRFYPSMLSGELWYDQNLRIEDERFLNRYLRPGDAVIDVGANIGQLTVQAAVTVGPSGKVVAIEAHPKIFRYLQGNVELNRLTNVILHNCAVGNTNCVIRFSDGAGDDQNAVAMHGDGIQIAISLLDGLLPGSPSIALLKIDVEGFEKFVLEGAERILRKTKCVYFESWDEHFKRFGYCVNDVIQLLERGGFTIYRLPAGDAVTPVSHDHHSPLCEDLVAVKDTRDFLDRTGFTISGSPLP